MERSPGSNHLPMLGGRTIETLLLDILQKQAEQDHRTSLAEHQRTLILQQQVEIQTEIKALRQVEPRLSRIEELTKRLEPLVEKGEEFRLKVEGGAIAMKLVYVVFGGLALWVFQQLAQIFQRGH